MWGYPLESPVPKPLLSFLPSSTIPPFAAVSIGCTDNLALLTKSVQKIYVWDVTEETNRPEIFEALRGKHVSEAGCGVAHGAVVTQSGNLWVWGSNDSRQLGLEDVESVPLVRPALLPLARVLAVGCGSEHTLALTAEGHVYSWGSGLFGRLGHGGDADESTPTRIEALTEHHITSITCGPLNSAAITREGLAFVWGSNDMGQLADDSFQPGLAPQPLSCFPQPVKQISFGDSHALSLLVDGSVWSWGNNQAGQLGRPTPSQAPSASPAIVTFKLSPQDEAKAEACIARQIVATSMNSFVLTESGHVWSWGAPDTKQLGYEASFERTTPTRITTLFHIAAISVGGLSCAALSEASEIFVWGWHLGEIPKLVTSDVFPDPSFRPSRIVCGSDTILLTGS
eukprot:TRINITY_DN4335_c0_g2_i7.p1 TRINITY_DN4335_c0_g2~~TRINITY_DN4335_c0_g2_i7.p1  ORF type:complete len:398 (-),score=58.95 TRINITY_DN4335_c0_g2_i7:40-1233(-)